MKTFKENFLIKTVFSYIDLFYKLFIPFIIIFNVIPLFLQFPSFPRSNWSHVDFLGLFTKERSFVNFMDTSIFFKSTVFLLNFLFLLGIFISLKKLNRFMKNVFEENPFNLENGKVLKSTGIIISILAVTVHISKSLLLYVYGIDSNLGMTSLMLTILNIVSVIFNPYMIIGLFVMVLGEIIVHGSQIKEEIDLTV